MSENKTIVPSVTIDCRQYCINVGRDVVRLLGCPECICILESERQHTIAFAPCDDSVVLSFKVPERFPEDRNRKFRIYSQSLVMEIMAKYDLDSGHAGNIGVMQNVDILVDAANLMKNDPTVCFHIIGNGVYKGKLQSKVEKDGINNVCFWPMQPPELAPLIYSSADVNVIPLKKDIYK